ncbi:pilus assembly protein PilP [Larsenimonas rhizosphaerae]|uniref:Pilus assembly protein PilP n=1 Tax=Larsenimonas rhizosphaerae TaxID=2944682 RepID=A0AA41ZHQ8_9GAMM|nr:pilus assembly protein PilP [Larsenimonas rhizosphaerae]MCX2524369.1 pilus assembly protein PilP [Larsenimonas rhizosphaerae]
MRRYGAVIVLLTTVLVGCDRPELDRLGSELDVLRDKPRGNVAPLPVVPVFDVPAYTGSGQRDPFMKYQPGDGGDDNDMAVAGLRPQPDRVKEPLEFFALSSLRLAGSLVTRSEAVALIMRPDGKLSRLKRGGYLGENSGQVVAISPRQVVIRELVSSPSGGWKAVMTVLTLGGNEAGQP